MADKTKWTKEEYDYYSSLPENELTQEEREGLAEYKSSLYGMPSKAVLEWSAYTLNKTGFEKKDAIESGDWAKAEEYIRLARSARDNMSNEGISPWVKPVQRTPESVAQNMKFNWKSAYENVNNTKLRPTEADADKLEKFVQSNLYDLGSDTKLMDVAQNLHMWNPGEQTWSDFISSEQGDRFREYLEDVRANQEKQAVDKIWSGEEPTAQWTPFGYKEVPGSYFATDFMTPVAKEYAKKHYKDKDVNTDLLGPLAFDVGMNLAMMGGGKAAQPFEKVVVKEALENASAPLISSVGNEVYNEEDPNLGNVVLNTAFGYGANKAAPFAINRGASFFARRNVEPSVKSVYAKAQESLDEAVNNARKIAEHEKVGLTKENDNLFLDNKKEIAYTNDPYETWAWKHHGWKTKPLEDMPTNKPVFDKSLEGYDNALVFERSGKLGDIKTSSSAKPDRTIKTKLTPNKNSATYNKELIEYNQFNEAVDKLRSGNINATDFKENPEAMRKASEYLGLPTMESRRNWIKNNFGLLTNYLTNVPGSTPNAQKKFGRTMRNLIPTAMYDFDKKDKKSNLQKLIKIYGL